MNSALRIARRFIRKAIKPIALRLNARQKAESDTAILIHEGERAFAAEMVALEHRRQVKLEQRRREIANW